MSGVFDARGRSWSERTRGVEGCEGGGWEGVRKRESGWVVESVVNTVCSSV